MPSATSQQGSLQHGRRGSMKGKQSSWSKVQWLVGTSICIAIVSVVINQLLRTEGPISIDRSQVLSFLKGFAIGCGSGLVVFLGVPWLIITVLRMTSKRPTSPMSTVPKLPETASEVDTQKKEAASKRKATEAAPLSAPSAPLSLDKKLGRIVYLGVQGAAATAVSGWPLLLTLIFRGLQYHPASHNTTNECALEKCGREQHLPQSAKKLN